MVKIPSKTIDQHQDEIIDAFGTLSDDRVAMLDYLIDLGTTLPLMNPLYKTEDYLVKGCMSKVWLMGVEMEGLLFLQADSNTHITKGLISLLVKILSGQLIESIIAAKLYFIEAMRMNDLIGFQRASGLAHMIKDIKLKALTRLA